MKFQTLDRIVVDCRKIAFCPFKQKTWKCLVIMDSEFNVISFFFKLPVIKFIDPKEIINFFFYTNIYYLKMQLEIILKNNYLQ